MSDNMINREYTFKKDCGWKEDHNFRHPDELMVEITLDEYRELVNNKAVQEYKLDKMKEEYNQKEEALKKEVERLKNIILKEKEEEEEEE